MIRPALLIPAALLVSLTACARESLAEPAQKGGFYGLHGLNLTPNARMMEPGTISFTTSALDPYVHGVVGFQAGESLHVALRQTSLVSGITDRPDRLYPGLDFKLRESALVPEVALGMQSAAGHRRMAAEYVALSKRYENFDFSAGLGWGRMAQGNTVKNPLGGLFSHFRRDRAPDGGKPNGPEDWFTGERMGFFAGVDYALPVEGLSLNAGWGGDRYGAESAGTDYRAPSPWYAGLNFSPRPWANLGVGIAGGDKIYARLSLLGDIARWPGRNHKQTEAAPAIAPHRSGVFSPGDAVVSAQGDDVLLRNASGDGATMSAALETRPGEPLPQQVGRAMRHMMKYGGATGEKFSIQPQMLGLQGPKIVLMRADFERALAHGSGSPEEIWRHASFDPSRNVHKDDRLPLAKMPLIFSFILDNDVSLSEEDHALLYRSSFRGGVIQPVTLPVPGLVSGIEGRITAAHNLEHLSQYRFAPFLPVRSDIDRFSGRRVGLDRMYLGWMKSITPEIHVAAAAGYLEEMYGGAGGEILYRPFGKTYAVGAELWEALHRDPSLPLALGYNGDHLLSGHVNFWYEFPDTALTLHVKAGRYLAGDTGATVGINHTFSNGARIEAFATMTNQSDENLFGDDSNAYSGVRLTLPVGNAPLLPKNSRIRTTVAPIGRDQGQALDNPLPLYELTEPLSYRNIAANWPSVTQ